MGTYITLIRHGETDWNSSERWQGFAPIPLNEQGALQAQQAAPFLIPAKITRIISSDLLRARQTAAIIAEKLQLPVEFDPRWREVNLGSWQGLSKDEIIAWDGERYEAFHAAGYDNRVFPNGESQQDHLRRTAEALEEIPHHSPDQHILVVTHGGSIRCVLFHLSGNRSAISYNCAITRLHVNGSGEWQILGMNEMASEVVWLI